VHQDLAEHVADPADAARRDGRTAEAFGGHRGTCRPGLFGGGDEQVDGGGGAAVEPPRRDAHQVVATACACFLQNGGQRALV
jgi:hypothetical protein